LESEKFVGVGRFEEKKLGGILTVFRGMDLRLGSNGREEGFAKILLVGNSENFSKFW
jgi:hypothetical protein